MHKKNLFKKVKQQIKASLFKQLQLKNIALVIISLAKVITTNNTFT